MQIILGKFLTLRLKVVIGFGVGLAVGVASAIIGLRGYANDPLVPLEIREAIPFRNKLQGAMLRRFGN